MTKEDFFELLSDIDDELVSASENYRYKKVISRRMKFAAAAACLCIAGGSVLIYNSSTQTDSGSSASGNIADTSAETAAATYADEETYSEDLDAGAGTFDGAPAEKAVLTGEHGADEEEYSTDNVKLLAAAVYPEMPMYPEESDFNSFAENEVLDRSEQNYTDIYKDWQDSLDKLRKQPGGYKDGTDKFITESMKTFLSGDGSENRIFSPLSVFMALGMSAEISDGNTRQQILELLGQGSIDELRSHARSIWQANYVDDGMAECITASSVWLNENIAFRQDTVDSLAENYYSSSYLGDPASDDFGAALRSWLSEQTDGMIDDSIRGVEISPETVIALASTVNYSGKWTNIFIEDNTKADIFHSPNGDIECDFMNREESMHCLIKENFKAVMLPLENNGYMRLVLPDEDISPEELLADNEFTEFSLSETNYFYRNSDFAIVDLSVPKFDVSSDIDLIDGLEEMGVTDAFDASVSDFSALSDNSEGIFISSAGHAARVTIDETGCRASAMTVIAAEGDAMPPPEKIEFILDRPFIFEIVSATDFPVFVGVVNYPVK